MANKTYSAFNKCDIEPPFLISFAAPRRSGKTTLITNLLLHRWRTMFDVIIIASPSLEFQDDYQIEDSFPDSTTIIKVKTNFEPTLKKLIAEQQEAQRLHKENPTEYDPVETLMILDDCIDSEIISFRSSSNIVDEIAERGRHYHMSLIISAQFLSAISPSVRRNCEALFIFSPLNFADTERVLGEYVPHEMKKSFYQEMMNVFKEPFSFVMIDGSDARRNDIPKRFRKGFLDYVFPTPPDDVIAMQGKKPSRKRKAKPAKEETLDKEKDKEKD